jgi:hypothetical protein
MKVVPVEKTDLTVGELAQLAKEGPVILTRKGKPLAAVRDLSGADWESVSLANNPQFAALIEESRRSFREEGGIGIEELRKELGLRPPPSRRARRGKKKT